MGSGTLAGNASVAKVGDSLAIRADSLRGATTTARQGSSPPVRALRLVRRTPTPALPSRAFPQRLAHDSQRATGVSVPRLHRLLPGSHFDNCNFRSCLVRDNHACPIGAAGLRSHLGLGTELWAPRLSAGRQGWRVADRIGNRPAGVAATVRSHGR